MRNKEHNPDEYLPEEYNKGKAHSNNRAAVTIQDIARIGMMVAVLEVSKLALSFLPNVELVTFWLILFTLFFGAKTVPAVFLFILVEGSLYGFGLWWFMYAYIWPSVALTVWLTRKQTSRWYWAFVSGIFGLLFGALCSLVYIPIGIAEGGLAQGLRIAFVWWIAGIPFDLIHGTSNFILMLVLFKPVYGVMRRVKVYGVR